MARLASSDGNLVINGGRLLALDDKGTRRAGVAILVEGGVVKKIGSKGDFSAATAQGVLTLDLADNDVILPGLINAHTHSAMALLRGLGVDTGLQTWLKKYMWPVEGAIVDDDFVRAGIELAMAEMLASGTTTFVDMYFKQDTAAAMVERVGMRAVLGTSAIDFPSPEGRTPRDHLRVAEAFVRKWSGRCSRITPAIAPHAPYTTSAWVYRAAVNLTETYRLPTILTHCAETKAEHNATETHQGAAAWAAAARFAGSGGGGSGGKRGGGGPAVGSPVAFLGSVGFLRPGAICAHAVWLSDSDIALLASTGTAVATCPSSNAKLGSGTLPYRRLQAKGINISLGTDGAASNDNLDEFEEAMVLSLIQKATTGDAAAVPAEAALRLATNGGAKALNRWADLGSIEPGKRADIAILSGATPNLEPLFPGAEASAAVHAGGGGSVKATIVDGRILFEAGCLPTIDGPRLASAVAKQRARVEAFLARRGGGGGGGRQ